MRQDMAVMVSQDTFEWFTPIWLLEVAREVLGEITFDPASNSLAQTVVQAREWAGPDHSSTNFKDGLTCKWMGNVWINPPYNKVNGKSSQAIWTQEAIKRLNAGEVNNILMIVNSKPGYKWYEEALDVYDACMLRERVCFLRNGEEVGPAKVGSTLLYLGQRQSQFVKICEKFGRILS